MTWARLEEGFPDHPKVVGLSDRAFRVFVGAICYANQYLTDGVVTISVQRHLRCTKGLATELVRAGLWEIHEVGAFLIHDYHRYQPTKADVLEQRRITAEQHSVGGRARAQSATRVGGRFAPATSPANRWSDAGTSAPAEHQPRTRPVPESLYKETRRAGTRTGELRAIRGTVESVVEEVGTRSDA